MAATNEVGDLLFTNQSSGTQRATDLIYGVALEDSENGYVRVRIGDPEEDMDEDEDYETTSEGYVDIDEFDDDDDFEDDEEEFDPEEDDYSDCSDEIDDGFITGEDGDEITLEEIDPDAEDDLGDYIEIDQPDEDDPNTPEVDEDFNTGVLDEDADGIDEEEAPIGDHINIDDEEDPDEDPVEVLPDDDPPDDDDNILTVPTIGKVYEGDTVLIALVEGVPTAIGVVGSGDLNDEDVNTLYSDMVVCNELIAEKANITDLTASNARITNLEATSLTADSAVITNLQAEDARIANLVAGKVDTTYLNANYITTNQIDAGYARLDATNINTATIRDAYVNQLMVQTGLLSKAGTIYSLDAIEVNAVNITAGTIDVNRLIYTDPNTNEKYLVDFTGSTPTYEKLDGNIVEPRTITADKIVAGAITVNEITTNNLVGTGGWINLSNGTFSYTNATSGDGIGWDGTNLTLTVGNSNITEPATLIRTYNNGVLVAKQGNTVGALVNSSGKFDIVGLNNLTPNNTTYASFGTNTVIGKDNSAQMLLDPYSLQLVDGSNTLYFGVFDNRRGSTATVNKEKIYFRYYGANWSPRYSLTIPVGSEITSITSVKINGSTIPSSYYRIGETTSTINFINSERGIQETMYGLSGASITFTSSALSLMDTPTGADDLAETEIEITYTSSDIRHKAFSLGSRSSTATEGATSTNIGYLNTATNIYSVAIGALSDATGQAAIAMNYYNLAKGNCSVATGLGTEANRDYSFSGGYGTYANGEGSVAFGRFTNVSGSHAMGIGLSNDVSGAMAFSGGCSNVCSGYCSLAYGKENEASGNLSQAFGNGTKAIGDKQLVIGKYNSTNNNRAFIIGNGNSDSSRSNALAVDWNGNMWLTGNLTVSGTLSANSLSLTNTLSVGNGGTGITSNPSMLVNLGSTSSASVFASSPRPGITGTLPINHGGTGQTEVETVSTISSIITAASGWTITAAYIYKWGKMVMFRCLAKPSSAVSGSGNVVGTLKSAYQPAVQAMAVYGYNSGCRIMANGEVQVSGSITANTSITISSTYLLA